MAVTSERRLGDWPGDSGDRDVNAWREREVKRLWREACEGYELCQWIPTPSGWTVVGPSIKRVTLGDPTVLLIYLRPTQSIHDLARFAPDIASYLGVGALMVQPFRGQWVRVHLLGVAAPSASIPARAPLPASRTSPRTSSLPSPLPSTVRPTRRSGPSTAWTQRWHARHWRRPEQPS